MLLLKILYLSLFGQTLARDYEYIIETLYNNYNDNRILLCLSSESGVTEKVCEGVLLRGNKVLTTNSCLNRYPLETIWVLRAKNGMSCSHIDMGFVSSEVVRTVFTRYEHPVAKYNIALIILTEPYDTDFTINTEGDIFNKYKPWLTSLVYLSEPHIPFLRAGSKQFVYDKRGVLLSLKIFAATVVLPLMSYLLFFFYVIFYTGKPTKNTVVHNKGSSDKKCSLVSSSSSTSLSIVHNSSPVDSLV